MQLQKESNHQGYQNTLENVSIRLQRDYQQNQTSLTIHIEMK